MTFQKGQSGNPKGRPLGTSDKRFGLVREAVSKALNQEPIDYLISEIIEIPTRKERVQHIKDLMPYMYAKLANVEHSGAIGGDGKVAESVDKLVSILSELK